jgi:phosphate acyltransferase
MHKTYSNGLRGSSGLPVAVDAMGGDLGPQVVVEGALQAARDLAVPSCLVGNENELRPILEKCGGASSPLVSVVHAPHTISMDDSPSVALRGKSRSSINVAFELLRDGRASSVVSPGNTGAVMAAGMYICGTLPGIIRPAIASLIPKIGGAKPLVLLDSGANVDCHAYQLVQFAIMGTNYAKVALSIASPRVALLSNGSEMSKGTDIVRSAAHSLRELKDLQFVGYVEGRDLGKDSVDVVVCDGFVGNIVLKAMEGTVELVVNSLKELARGSFFRSLQMWCAKPALKAVFSEKLDPSSHGGAPLLGLNGVAIICHGSSNSKAIYNGIRVAAHFSDQKLTEKLSESLEVGYQNLPGAYDDDVWARVGQRFDKRARLKRSKAEEEKESEKSENPRAHGNRE